MQLWNHHPQCNLKISHCTLLNFETVQQLLMIPLTLRGPSTLTWELRTGDCKITLEDKQKIANLTYYISSESLKDAESE